MRTVAAGNPSEAVSRSPPIRLLLTSGDRERVLRRLFDQGEIARNGDELEALLAELGRLGGRDREGAAKLAGGLGTREHMLEGAVHLGTRRVEGRPVAQRDREI